MTPHHPYPWERAFRSSNPALELAHLLREGDNLACLAEALDCRPEIDEDSLLMAALECERPRARA